MSACGTTDMPMQSPHVRFSNRPFGVKHFQTFDHATVSMSLAGSCLDKQAAINGLV